MAEARMVGADVPRLAREQVLPPQWPLSCGGSSRPSASIGITGQPNINGLDSSARGTLLTFSIRDYVRINGAGMAVLPLMPHHLGAAMLKESQY